MLLNQGQHHTPRGIWKCLGGGGCLGCSSDWVEPNILPGTGAGQKVGEAVRAEKGHEFLGEEVVSGDRCSGVRRRSHDTGSNRMLPVALPRTVSVDGEEVAAAWVSAGKHLLGAKNKEWGVKGREGISSNSRGTQESF